MSAIWSLPELGQDACLLAAVRERFAQAVAEGAITRFREPPTGEESIVWISDGAALHGFATYFDVGHGRLWLDVLWVWPERRRQGIGGRLLDAVVARAGGFEQVMFGTLAGNGAMQGLAASRGFQIEGHFYARAVWPECPRGGERATGT